MYTTRIAPSPTGDMHLGTARTAYFNWLCARSSGGRFIIRIDDTDLERHREDCVKVIYDTMDWLGLDYDYTFRQSERGKRYAEVAEQLLGSGAALRLSNGAIALRWSDKYPNKWIDEIAGEIPITQTNIDQIHERVILLRGGEKLGQPTYQFSSIVDDYDTGVNYIIRGVDHQTNTPKQLAVWWAIEDMVDKHSMVGGSGKSIPKFAHVGLIFKDKKKLSKRDSASSMLYYRDQGYSQEALKNFMLLTGWGSPLVDTYKGIIPHALALELFPKGHMRGANANFDAQKLEWYQKVYSK